MSLCHIFLHPYEFYMQTMNFILDIVNFSMILKHATKPVLRQKDHKYDINNKNITVAHQMYYSVATCFKTKMA